MHYDQYVTKIDFMNWFKKYHTDDYQQYFRLHQELETRKFKNQTINRHFERERIEQLEKELSAFVERFHNQYDYEINKRLPEQYISITKLERPEFKESQQTFAKHTKRKISWGVTDKDVNVDTNAKKLNFIINGKIYQLEYRQGYSVEVDRTPIKKIAIKQNKDGTQGVNFYTQKPKHRTSDKKYVTENSTVSYKDKPKERMIPAHYIYLHSTSEDGKTRLSQIASVKENNVWKHTEFTNLKIVDKINKFIKDNNL